MKYIIALLLGLSLSVYSESVEEFSLDDNSGEEYDGAAFGIYTDSNGFLKISFSTDVDDHDDVYCLTFNSLFEATDYDVLTNTDADYESNEEFDVTDFATVETTDADGVVTGFVATYNVNGVNVDLAFTYTADIDENGNPGLEYTVTVPTGWVWNDASGYLVMGAHAEDCSIDYSYSGDSGEDSEDDDEEMSSTAAVVRRLQEDDDEEEDADTDSGESDSGVSSDDSGEFDTGSFEFINDADGATFGCDTSADGAVVAADLVYQSADEQIHIVYTRWADDCGMVQDPSMGLDGSKQGAGSMISTVFAMFAGIIALLF